jgi:uncharacterized protein YecT (DUF1311 family)
MKRLACIVAVAAVASAAATQPAGAVDAALIEQRYTPALQQCLDRREGQSTHGTIACVGAEMKIQDAALNAAYRDALTRLNPRQQGKLRTAQRAWLAFRDADCAAHHDEDWGSLSTISANFCVLRRTVERTIELEEFAVGD